MEAGNLSPLVAIMLLALSFVKHPSSFSSLTDASSFGASHQIVHGSAASRGRLAGPGGPGFRISFHSFSHGPIFRSSAPTPTWRPEGLDAKRHGTCSIRVLRFLWELGSVSRACLGNLLRNTWVQLLNEVVKRVAGSTTSCSW